VPRGLHLPCRLIIRRFELSDKTYSKTNFEPAIRGSVRRASGLVLADHLGVNESSGLEAMSSAVTTEQAYHPGKSHQPGRR
jgi:hypothetical protein